MAVVARVGCIAARHTQKKNNRVQTKLAELFDRQISMVELFEYPTIHTLAQHLTLKPTQQTTQNRADNRRTRQTSLRQQKQARQKHRSKR